MIVRILGGESQYQIAAQHRAGLDALDDRLQSAAERDAEDEFATVRRQLLDTARRLCTPVPHSCLAPSELVLADMPKPRVVVSRMDLPNAFATGRNADHAALCVTTGLLRRLEPEELEGALAHELSHVAHRDMAVITIASFLGVFAGLTVRFAFYSELFGGRDQRDDQNTALTTAAVMAVSVTVYALSFLLIRVLSRYREMAADRAAAQLTGRPSALASALVKVSGGIARIPTEDLRTAQPFNAFFFTPALTEGSALSTLFSTQPSLERLTGSVMAAGDLLPVFLSSHLCDLAPLTEVGP
ncbi:M48 family metalloprotease [Streptomyces sp. NPDC094438]|uniref:PspA-associated protein PspAA n=1 Tax=Streptomyces sp. NPDC094438 TaxID=3366061 RepID=UPI0038086DFC